MMHGREKSDPATVAMKPANKVVLAAAELVERRAGAGGNARQQSTRRTQTRAHVTHALDRVPASSEVAKEGAVNRAPPPCQCRYTPDRVLRAQAQGGPWRGRNDMAGIRDRS